MDYKQKLIEILGNAKTIGDYNQAVILNDSLNLLTKKEMYKYLNRKVQKVFSSFLADLLYFNEALDYSERFGNGIYDSDGVNVDRLVSKTVDPLIDKLAKMGVEPYGGVSFNETKKEMEQYLRENKEIVSSI